MAKKGGGPTKPPKRVGGKSSKKKTPFWQQTSFILSALAILISILLTLEPVVNKVDELLGTRLSRRSGRSLMTIAADDLCEEHPGACKPASNANPNQPFQVAVINKSEYRVDVYLSDGKLGQVVGDIEGNGESLTIDTIYANQYYITRHGVREGLVDPESDQQHTFQTNQPGQVFIIPDNAAPSTIRCKDRFPDSNICQQYAKTNKCWETPGWMIVHCCESCQKYSSLDAQTFIDNDIRCTKERFNITDGVWLPGDLHKLFEKWSTDQAYRQYNPTVLSSPATLDANGNPAPWVMTFDNFFTAEEAQALIEGGRLAGFRRSSNQGAINAQGEMEMVKSVTRTSSNAWCLGDCQTLPGVITMTKRIEETTSISEKNFEPFQVLDYQENQFYTMHHDSEGRDLKPPGNRILTFFLYLSDVEEGGETKFNKLDIQVKPKLGRALIWPSVRDEDPGFWDDRMYHEAMPVIKGKKYAANHWIHLNDFETPNKWGCTGSFS